MSALRIADDVKGMGIVAVAFMAEGIDQTQAGAASDVLREAERETRPTLSDTAIEEDPLLAGYRELHEQVGAGRRHVAAPEALRRMLLRSGRLPRIGALVDLYNSYSLTSRLAVGVHDAQHVVGDVWLRRLDGGECFVPLGAREEKGVRAGEYAYVDAGRNVLCRLEVQQGDATKITATTTRCLVIVQGNPAFPVDAVERGAAELGKLIERHCSARIASHAQAVLP